MLTRLVGCSAGLPAGLPSSCNLMVAGAGVLGRLTSDAGTYGPL